MRTEKGSLTVEGAIIFPIVLALFLVTMQTGITLCGECRETAAWMVEEEKQDTIKLFYICKLAGEAIKDED